MHVKWRRFSDRFSPRDLSNFPLAFNPRTAVPSGFLLPSEQILFAANRNFVQQFLNWARADSKSPVRFERALKWSPAFSWGQFFKEQICLAHEWKGDQSAHKTRGHVLQPGCGIDLERNNYGHKPIKPWESVILFLSYDIIRSSSNRIYLSVMLFSETIPPTQKAEKPKNRFDCSSYVYVWLRTPPWSKQQFSCVIAVEVAAAFRD